MEEENVLIGNVEELSFESEVEGVSEDGDC